MHSDSPAVVLPSFSSEPRPRLLAPGWFELAKLTHVGCGGRFLFLVLGWVIVSDRVVRTASNRQPVGWLLRNACAEVFVSLTLSIMLGCCSCQTSGCLIAKASQFSD